MRWHSGGMERCLLLCVTGAALLFLWTLAKPLRTGHVPTYWDLGAFHLPLREWYAQCLARGWDFDWAPGMFNGLYLTGEGEHGPYHPAHLLGYRFLPLDRAFALEVFLPFPLMLLGMFVFLRRHVRPSAAMLGGLVYTFSANNICHGFHVNFVAVLAHLPWLLWLIDELVNAATPARRLLTMAGIGLLTGSQLLLGHPQAMSYSLLAEIVYCCFLLKPFAQPFRVGLPLLAAKLLGVLVGAVQLLATWEFMGNSSRTSVDPNFGSLPFSLLVQLIAPATIEHPDLGWCYEGFYFGMVPIILLLCWVGGCLRKRVTGDGRQAAGEEIPAIVSLRHSATPPLRHFAIRHHLAWFALVLGVLAAWLAAGSHGGLYSLQQMLPMVKHFRAPGRYINLLGFAAGVLSAVVFDRLMDWVQTGQRISWRRLWIPWLGVAAALAVALAFRGAYPGADQHGLSHTFFSGPLLLFAAAVALTLTARGHATGLFALLLLATFDMNFFIVRSDRLGIPLWRYTPTLAEWKDGAPLPPRTGAGPVLMMNMRALVLMMHGERLVNGYKGGIEPRKYLDYLRPTPLRLAGAAWCCVCDRELERQALATHAEFRLANKGWYEVAKPLARARLLSRTRVSEEPAADLPAIDVATTALVTHPIDVDAGRAGTANLLGEKPGELRLQVDAPGRQLLTLADSFDPGWQVEVDGWRRTVERVNGDFMGCVVEAGRHDVYFVFRPASIYYGRRLSLAGLAIALFMAAVALGGALLQRKRTVAIEAGSIHAND